MQKVGKVTKMGQKAVKFLDNNGLYNFKLFAKVIRENFWKSASQPKKNCHFKKAIKKSIKIEKVGKKNG